MGDQLSSDLASLRIARGEPPRSRGGFARAAITLVLLAGVGGAAKVAYPSLEAKVFKTEVSATQIALVSPAQASIDLTSTGYVVPQITTKIGAKIVGRISKVHFKEGDKVKVGQILFELDPTDQRSAVASAQARVAAAQARARASQASAVEGEIQLEREKKLAASGSIAVATVDDLAARVNSLHEAVKAAEAESTAANAEVMSLAVGLKNLTITSPMDGTAVTKPSEAGDVVGPTTPPLVELADFDSLVVESDVPEARLNLVKINGPCEIILDAYPDHRYRGQVLEVSPRLNRSKATATVKVKFTDPTTNVLPEMAGRVSFLAKALDDQAMKEPPKIVVPAAAVAERAGGKVVFVIDNGKVRMQTVRLGAPFSGGFELADGPAAGTKLVKEPPAALTDGQAVMERNE